MANWLIDCQARTSDACPGFSTVSYGPACPACCPPARGPVARRVEAWAVGSLLLGSALVVLFGVSMALLAWWPR